MMNEVCGPSLPVRTSAILSQYRVSALLDGVSSFVHEDTYVYPQSKFKE